MNFLPQMNSPYIYGGEIERIGETIDWFSNNTKLVILNINFRTFPSKPFNNLTFFPNRLMYNIKMEDQAARAYTYSQRNKPSTFNDIAIAINQSECKACVGGCT